MFKYSGDFKNRIGDGVRDAVIRVTYFDNGTDGFKVSYVGKGARYTTFNIVKTNTQQWITKEQKVSDFTAAFIDPREGAKTQTRVLISQYGQRLIQIKVMLSM